MAKGKKRTRHSRRINQGEINARASAATSATARPWEPRQSLLVPALLGLLVLAAYGNSLDAGFVFDDRPIIVENTAIRSLAQIPSLFATGYWDREGYQTDRLYRPLVMATYALNYAASGLNAWVYHLTNLILHLVVCWTLYLLGRRLGLSNITAFGAAALFAVHPVNTEAVTGIVGRAELMMGAGVLLALLLDIRCNPVQAPAKRLALGSMTAFGAALLSKEQAMMLPALFLVSDAARFEVQGAARFRGLLASGKKRYVALAVILLAYLLLRYWVLGGLVQTGTGFVENPLAHADQLTRILTGTKVAGYYLWLVLWPAQLSADYSYNAIPLVRSWWDPGVLLGAAAWAGLIVWGVYAFRQRKLPVAIGISMTVLFFVPASNLIVPIGTIMGERLFYLPFAGLCLAVGAVLEQVRRLAARRNSRQLRWGLTGVLAIVLVLLAVRTAARNRDWQSDFTLFQSAVTANPGAAKARMLLGAWLGRQGRTDEAISELEQAAAIYPDYALRHTFAEEMGNLLLVSARPDEALSLAEKALAASPEHPSLLHIYGRALQQSGQWEEAAAKHARALEIARELGSENSIAYVNGLYDLAQAYAFQEKWREADALLAKGLEVIDNALSESVTPRDIARFVSFRTIVLSQQQDYRSAQPLFQRLLPLVEATANPGDFFFLAQPLASYAQYLRAMDQDAAARRVERQIDRISKHGMGGGR